MPRFAMKRGRGLCRNIDTSLDQFAFDRAPEIEAPSNRAGGGQHVINTVKIDISYVHAVFRYRVSRG